MFWPQLRTNVKQVSLEVHTMNRIKKTDKKKPELANYLSDYSYIRDIGDYPKDVYAIDYINSKAKHGLKQIVPPLVTSEKLEIGDYGESTNHLLDIVYATDSGALKFALSEMANLIARLTHSFQDAESLAVFKATLIENLVSEASDFIDDFPELLPNYTTCCTED